ncbi:MAG: carbamoyl-phosphate synthase (glutamine-hydrolyzing) large subunit [Candidatus Eisenbacteria bacterium]|nr:carbamoyl-phosphate synthase (glutamine-hydrolyzing) large subunit [Candidatus Eisenbacteria bacterium]
MSDAMPRKVLLLGSGGLRIGQAGEFDYSGSQALKALRAEGVATVLVNPNIATVQTSAGMADRLYLHPVDAETVARVIAAEGPDGLLLGFGGQTALNVGMELADQGVLARFGVRVLGTPIEAIKDTEDRQRFVARLAEIDVATARSRACATLTEAADAADEIGYPVMLRSAYSLGGQGSGVAHDRPELERIARRALAQAPQILIEEYLGGWKEVEYEVVRDAHDNCIAVCNMENLDPMGIHTGESIVVAPSQTLSNADYHMLREVALRTIRHLGIVGECNIQYALDPHSAEYRVIEVNARLSRSSALASKATGYPLAAVAAHLALGRSLASLPNAVTGCTVAFFEPALDYVVVKVPRWDLERFRGISTRIGSEMMSVGEVMAIGRSFEEALQKALRMISTGMHGLVLNRLHFDDLRTELAEPTHRRVFAVGEAFAQGMTVDAVHELTRIDRWFLHRMAEIVETMRALTAGGRPTGSGTVQPESASRGSHSERSAAPAPVPDAALLRRAKELGFSDFQIGKATGIAMERIREIRQAAGIVPVIKQIDTLAAEYPAVTNYLYMTYGGSASDVEARAGAVMVLGGGPYRIGSSVEFDWCCVHAVEAARRAGYLTVMVNCNPETVSTDYDICDRLYFDELTLERALDIYEFENPEGVIVSMGGQVPNTLAPRLDRCGARILGTSAHNIDRAEDRNKFSSLLDELEIDQPAWCEARSIEEARTFAAQAGYPVMIRPSYVLSGAAMAVVYDAASLGAYLTRATDVNPATPVVVSKFIENAKEIEFDGVAREGEILLYAIGEHVENAGVHSGDATVVIPPQRMYVETARRVKQAARRIAGALEITGPFNIQFIAQENRLKVIECNLRASRTFPFASKVLKHDFIELATRAILGEPTERIEGTSLDLDRVGVKAAQFSFARLKGADPTMGVAMASTGEVGCLGLEMEEALLSALRAVGLRLGEKTALVSTGPPATKAAFLPVVLKLQRMGYRFFATSGTARFLRSNGIAAETLRWPLEGKTPNCTDYIRDGRIGLVINIPKSNEEEELSNDYLIRRLAIDHHVPLLTNLRLTERLVEALENTDFDDLPVREWSEV